MKWLSRTEDGPVAAAVIDALAEGGVRYVVGMPGGLTGPLWQALHQHPTIRGVQVREESIGSTMAEAYGRLTGEPMVVMGQGEWIVGNAGQGYMESLLGSSPLLILTEMSDGGSLSHHAPYQSGSADYGTWDTRTALAGVTKRVWVSHSPAQAVQHTQLALKHALTGDPGPVAVVFHSTSLQGTVGPTSVPRIYPTPAYLPRPSRSVDERELAASVEALRMANRPVILAGNGVRLAKARDGLLALARALDIPVATTASGKGVIDERDPLAVGVIGPFGWATANASVGEADLVLAIGTKLSPSDTINAHVDLIDPERQVIIQIEVEPLNASWTTPADHVLIGDAGFVMDRLREAYAASGTASRSNGAERVHGVVAEHRRADAPGSLSDSVPLDPQRIIAALGESLTDDAIVTGDAGENRLFMMQWFHATQRGEYLQPAAGGGMGYAVPAAMAAKLVHPDRAVLAVCGDGGFAMSIHALMSALQERLPIGVLVFNNGALGWVLHSMGEKAMAANFAEFDHAAIARSLGCDGVRVATITELRDVLKTLGDLVRPLVIDVPTSLGTSFQDVASPLSRRQRSAPPASAG
jgi:acetolactate synthase I/II/III large subunit